VQSARVQKRVDNARLFDSVPPSSTSGRASPTRIPIRRTMGPIRAPYRQAKRTRAIMEYAQPQIYRGYKDGLQPEPLADGNWLVKQNQPVSKIETKSDTNLSSLYES